MDTYLRRVITGLLCVVIFGVALQAPISVWADIWGGSYALFIKSWKEILLGVAAILTAVLVYRSGDYQRIVRSRILWLVGAIALVHLIVMLGFNHPILSEGAGLVIDLRNYLAFAIGFILITLYPRARKPIVYSFLAAMALVLVFAFLQVTVLPRDFLAVLGYSIETIAPYQTVDLNDSYIRINSFLRGPNPLGAYAVIGLAGVLAFAWRQRDKLRRFSRPDLALTAGGLTLSLVAIWFSYSRSALIAAVIVVLGMLIAISSGRWVIRIIASSIMLGVVSLVGLFALRDVPFIANVVFHTNEESTSAVKSDDDHLDSLQDGIESTLESPLGVGIGTAGSPSLLTDSPKIIENQYLYIAHESGLIGLLLQIGLLIWVLLVMWRYRRRDWLVLAVGTSGVGLAVVGLVLPVWVDDTVGLTWWMLAGVALAGVYWKRTKQEQKTKTGNTLNAGKSDQETAEAA